MVQGKWFPADSDCTLSFCVREEVFAQGRDEVDEQAWQVVVYADENTPVGSARLWWQDGAFWLGCVGVKDRFRGQGYGDLLVRLLMFKALTHNARMIRLQAPTELAAFFKQYGFEAGEEANGLITMQIQGENVQLSHCGGHCENCNHRTDECTPKALR